MLKISDASEGKVPITLRLEGRLVGPWVGAARDTCEKFLREGRALTLNLAEVAFVDADGVILLQNLVARGVALTDCSLFVEEQLKSVSNV